jgi:hypothetical protein
MKLLAVSCIVVAVVSIAGSAKAHAQVSSAAAAPLASSWITTSMPEAGQRDPTPGIQLSETQRRGMRWGARIGIIAGLGIAWLVAVPDDDECVELECVGRAAALPFHLAVGMLGGMVAGGAVGLGVGTIFDDSGESQSTLELRVRLAP